MPLCATAALLHLLGRSPRAAVNGDVYSAIQYTIFVGTRQGREWGWTIFDNYQLTSPPISCKLLAFPSFKGRLL